MQYVLALLSSAGLPLSYSLRGACMAIGAKAFRSDVFGPCWTPLTIGGLGRRRIDCPAQFLLSPWRPESTLIAITRPPAQERTLPILLYLGVGMSSGIGRTILHNHRSELTLTA
jgi:hypothetical protein